MGDGAPFGCVHAEATIHEKSGSAVCQTAKGGQDVRAPIHEGGITLQLVAIGVGGAIGAVLRFVISGLAYSVLGQNFPWGTFVVNMIGCFLIGFLAQLFEEIAISPNLRVLILVGGLGAFTTFSTYALENVNLLRDGQVSTAFLNIMASTVLGIIFVFLGMVLANYLSVIVRSG
ncbi:MAG: fluoride efflux transporter CrcB [Anaerolineae bacterium]|nr:fluoride efflux transporter CrcB [Anaerolineae bacterium]